METTPLQAIEVTLTPAESRAVTVIPSTRAHWVDVQEMARQDPRYIDFRVQDLRQRFQSMIDQVTSPALLEYADHILPLFDDVDSRETELGLLHKVGGLMYNLGRGSEHTEKLLRSDEGYFFDDELQTLALPVHAVRNKIEEMKWYTHPQSSRRLQERTLVEEIASILTLPDGSINYAAIPMLRQRLPEMMPEWSEGNHTSPLREGLDRLELHPRLRSIIEECTLEGLHPKGEELIRLSCQLSWDEPVTKAHLTRTLISGLCSRLRQGSVGSCFATAVGYGIQAWEPERVLKDFVALLKEGFLTRTIEGKVYRCPASTKAVEDDVNHWISFASGYFASKVGFRRALVGTGIDDAKPLIEEGSEVTYRDGFAQIASHLRENGETASIEELVQRMVNQFEAANHDPLLRAWESSVASMAEAMADGLCARKLINALKKALSFEGIPLHRSDLELLEKGYQEAVVSRCQYVFDPAIRAADVGQSGGSKGSGFVLYDQKGSNNPDEWERVDSPKQMRRFLLDCFKEYLKPVIAEATPEAKRELIQRFIPAARQHLLSDECLIDLMKAYGTPSSTPLASHASLKKTPWMDVSGHFTSRVVQVYYELDEKRVHPTFHPLSAEHLLRRIMEIAKALPEDVQRTLERRPHLPFAVTTVGHHTFSLLLGDPVMRSGWLSDLSPRQWMEEELNAPARAAAQTEVTEEELDRAIEILHQKELYSDTTREKFLELTEKIPRSGLWRCELRNRLVEAVCEAKGLHMSFVARSVDRRLFSILPEEEKQALLGRMVRFADTNWYNKEHDVQLAIGPNPWVGGVTLYKVDDDTNELRDIDPQKWTTNAEWRLYPYDNVGYCPSEEALA